MFKNTVLISLVILCQSITGRAQTRTIERLKHDLSLASTPSEQLDAALAICEQSHSLSADTFRYYAFLSKDLASKLNNKRKVIVARTYIENYLIRENLFDSAIGMCDEDLKDLSYSSNRDGYARTVKEKCFCLMRSNRSRTALDVAFPFLAETEKYGDTVSEVYTETLIGVVYRNLQQTELAMRWFLKADSSAPDAGYEKVKNEIGVYFLMGMMYNWRLYAATVPAERLRDSVLCIRYLDRAIADSRRYDNLVILAKALNVKASTIGDPSTAEMEGDYVKEASAIYAQLRDTVSMLNTISPMSFYYIDEGHPEKGVEACLAGIRTATRNDNFPILDLYEALSQCYKAEGDMGKYATTLNSIIEIKDSLYKANTEKDLAELNARYNDQKKENIIIRQKLDIASKRYSVLLFSILTAVLLAGILLLYRYFYQKQKKMKSEQRTAVTAAEEAERKRISADLHDNLGAYAAAAASSISYIHASDDQSTERLGLLKHNVQNIVTQLNDSIWALNKRDVLLTGLSDRFKIFLQKLQPSYAAINIRVIEKIGDDRVVSSIQALHLFRMMQEAVNNALRHSKCTSVQVVIESSAAGIRISVEDNGLGITNGRTDGNGINNLNMRAAELGWCVQWLKNETGGTSVIFESAPGANTAN